LSAKSFLLLDIPLDKVAEQILLLNGVSVSQARNAYAAVLLIPGMECLRFSLLLKQCRRQWNSSTPKYSVFWSMEEVVARLAKQPLNWNSVLEVRNRLIMVWRLFALHRSVELSRIYRKVSFVGGEPFVLLRRKGWNTPRWEQVVVLETVSLSPFHLLKRYVELTSFLPEGSLVLRALKEPYSPISSDRVASLTKVLLSQLGVPTSFWTAHSTRGAAVSFYKKLGLSSEEVCELGQWKNTQAFTQHYLRLGAHKVARQKVTGFVHRVSQGLGAEPDGSHTPPTKDRGGRDPEGEATRNCEPNPPTLVAPRGPVPVKRRPVCRKRKRSPPKEIPKFFQFAKRTPSPSPPSAKEEKAPNS
jgi:hypothetical protein